jgi:hypothetical protein
LPFAFSQFNEIASFRGLEHSNYSRLKMGKSTAGASAAPTVEVIKNKEFFMTPKTRLAARITLIALMSLGVLCCQDAAKTLVANANQISSSMGGSRQEAVVDPAYGMTAYTIDVPAGWKFAGMILRPGGCHPPPTPSAGLSYTAQSPDGVTELVTLPGVSWSWTSNGTNIMGPKCPSTMNIDTAAGLLLNIALPNLHPGATKVELVPLKKGILDAIASQNATLASGMRSYGLKGRQYVDAAEAHTEYQLNGRAMEEEEFTVVDCMESQTMGMPMGNGRWSQGYTKRTCSSRGTVLKRAPKGQLQQLLANSKPPKINPEWDQRVIQDMKTRFQQFQAASDAAFKQNMANFKAQGDARTARAQAFDQNLRESTNHAMAADRARQDAIDASAHKMTLYAGDQQEFTNPTTGQVIQTNNQYNHQWMSSDGTTLIQTNDHTYDPNGQVYPISQSWTELVPK